MKEDNKSNSLGVVGGEKEPVHPAKPGDLASRTEWICKHKVYFKVENKIRVFSYHLYHQHTVLTFLYFLVV